MSLISGGCECTYIGAPASLFGSPADLSLTHTAANPVAAVFLLNHNLTGRAVHCVASLHHFLYTAETAPPWR